MNNKQQFAALGVEITPRCMARHIEWQQAQIRDATRQCGALAELLREARAYVQHYLETGDCNARPSMRLICNIDALLAGKVPDHIEHPLAMVPEGWQIVPVDVTPTMQHAYFGVIDKNMQRVKTDCRFGRYDSSKEAYRAMLAAAPKPQGGELCYMQF